MLGAATSIGIARQGEAHLASQQTFPAKEQSLIHQHYPFGSSASFTAQDVSHLTAQQPAHTSFRQPDDRKVSAPHLHSSQEDFKTAGFVAKPIDKKRLFADDDDDYEY